MHTHMCIHTYILETQRVAASSICKKSSSVPITLGVSQPTSRGCSTHTHTHIYRIYTHTLHMYIP